MPNANVLEIDGIHQVVQGDVGVASTESREQRRHQAAEGDHRSTSECAEQEIEPDDVRLEAVNGADDANGTAWVIERPAAQDRETRRLDMISGQFVGQHGQAQKGITLQFLRDVEPIFT